MEGGGGATNVAAFKFHATVEVITWALLHNSFLLVQPTLTRAVKAICRIKFGGGDWLVHYKSFLRPSKQEFAVDDGRVFDMCACC